MLKVDLILLLFNRRTHAGARLNRVNSNLDIITVFVLLQEAFKEKIIIWATKKIFFVNATTDPVINT